MIIWFAIFLWFFLYAIPIPRLSFASAMTPWDRSLFKSSTSTLANLNLNNLMMKEMEMGIIENKVKVSNEEESIKEQRKGEKKNNTRERTKPQRRKRKKVRERKKMTMRKIVRGVKE